MVAGAPLIVRERSVSLLVDELWIIDPSLPSIDAATRCSLSTASTAVTAA